MNDVTLEQQATLDRWHALLARPQPDNTLVGNPHDAYSYYQFIDGIPTRIPCPSGLIFNPDAMGGPGCEQPHLVSVDANPAPRK